MTLPQQIARDPQFAKVALALRFGHVATVWLRRPHIKGKVCQLSDGTGTFRALTGAFFVTLLAVSPASAAESPLERYRPVLRYDSAETYFAQPISREEEVIDRDLVYGHVAVEGGETWLQYWLFYAYNPQDRGVFATGRHEGDWEFVQLRLDEARRPGAATFAQHSTAEACSFDELTTERLGSVDVPVVYVANGSHASYSRADTFDRPWPDPNDEADGAVEVRPAMKEITDDDPAWVGDPDPWGDSRAGWVPGEGSSPPGPMFQADGRWAHPGSFHASALPCGSEPPGRPWQTPALVVGGLVLLGGGLLIRRRRRA